MAEVRQCVVRRRPAPIGQPIGEPDDPAAQRLEGQRHHDREEQGRPEPAARRLLRRSTQGHDEAHVADGDEGGRDREHHGSAEDHLDVVEPVAQYGDGDAGEQEGVRQEQRHARPPRLLPAVERLPDDQDHQSHPDRRGAGRDHPELLTCLPVGAVEPQQHAGHAREDAQQDHEETDTQEYPGDGADVQGFAAPVEAVWTDPQQRQELGRISRQRGAQDPSPPR